MIPKGKIGKVEKILIATATMDKMVSSGLASLFAAVHEQNHREDRRYEFSTLILENIQGYALMRNMASKAFLDSDMDRLWFWDNDVVPADNALDMLDVDADICAAVVPFVHCTSGAYMKVEDLDDLSSMSAEYGSTGSLLDVTCVGTACTWIKRRVLEDPGMYYSRDFVRPDGRKDRLNDDEAPCIFQYHYLPNGGTNMGEDFDFTYRASKLGYRVRYDGRVVCDHVKQMALLEVIERARLQWEEATASMSKVANAIQ
jgi:hypothetical protein